MAQQYPKLVNKQFNSPINLYSEANVKEVLERESQVLANGAVGVNFYNPSVTTKPTNLQNSAVLRMLEEEEQRQRNGQPPSLKRVAWPPPCDDFDEQAAVQEQGGQQLPSSPGVQNNRSPIPHNPQELQNHQPVTASTYQPASSPTPGYQQQQPVPQAPSSGFNQPAPRGWASVQSPASPQPYRPAQSAQQNLNQPFNQPTPSQVSASPVYQPAAAPSQPAQANYNRPQQLSQGYKPAPVEPPPAIITLRPQAPVSQAPPPVYTSQPATATLKGGKNLRGDLKWPPENVKCQMEEENRKRVELAKGPAFRPRKVKKDYSSFFAQHALNSTYPGYKAPPGTQFYDSIANY